MNNQLKSEMTYLMIFSVLKRLFENGSIDRKVFDRLNTKNAEQQGCQAIIF